ncbi:uncharacterized protein PV09_02715 [Verruconis gallopava]|uniref:Uncharacterized protein n=1 Tax=Verruconis gallopava TaxID=253628 RepID=A0A0D1XTY4_9PEZI|nr:uncharacterized protein PV09_02715 [Verruconis gallopava]KIW06241.1 hypothetical protein PV09_02715 [Verruconis gallopava]
MHLPSLLTLVLAATGVAGQWRMKRGQAASGLVHRVGKPRSLDSHLIMAHQALAKSPRANAVVAFYEGPLCQGVPVYLHARNLTCYGPVRDDVTFTLLAADPDCQVMIRRHPCGVDRDATIMDTDGSCYAGSSDPKGLDVWVQCGVPSAIQAPPPAPKSTSTYSFSNDGFMGPKISSYGG